MPFKSEKQRRFLWRNHPEIAREWADKYPQKGKLPLYANRKKKVNTVKENDQNTSYVENSTNQESKKTPEKVSSSDKVAADKLVKVELPQSDEPMYAGQDDVPDSVDISENEEEVGKVEKPENPEKNKENITDEMDDTAAEILKKFSAVISPVLRQKIEDNMAALEHRDPAPVRKNPSIKAYEPESDVANSEQLNPALTTGEQGVNNVQQPAKPQDPNGPVGGGSNPQANVIKSFGPLSASGNLNGNAAFGAKNSPNSSKTSSAINALPEKIAMRRRANNCMCTGVKAYDCSCKKNCMCKQPGMSCAKYVHPEKETPSMKKTSNIHDVLTKWAFLVGASGGKSKMKKPKALRIKKPKKTYMKRSVAAPDWYGAETSAYTSPDGKDIGTGVYHGLPVGPKDKQPTFMAKLLGGGTRTVAQNRVPDIIAKLKKIKGVDVHDNPVDGRLEWGWGVNDQVPYDGTPEMQQGIEQALRGQTSKEKQAGKSPAWQRSEGQNSEGGLNAKGRASYNKATGGNLKAPVTQKNPKGKAKSRRASFCARMGGMKKKLTGAKTKSDPDSRINKALRKWNC